MVRLVKTRWIHQVHLLVFDVIFEHFPNEGKLLK